MLLDDLIENEIEMLNKLSEILDMENDVLIINDAEKIPNILDEKVNIALKIKDIEKAKIQLCNGKAAKDCVKDGELDEIVYKKLICITDNIKQKSATNMALTKQSLMYISSIKNILNPKQPIVKYGHNGRIGDNRENGLFTIQA